MSALASSALSGSRFPSCAISNSCRVHLSRSLRAHTPRALRSATGGRGGWAWIRGGGAGCAVGMWGVPCWGGARSKGGHALSDLLNIFLVLESLHAVHVFIRLQKDALRLYVVGLRRVQLVLENQGHLRVQQRVGIVEVWMRRQGRVTQCVAHKWNDGSAAHRAPASTSLRLHRDPCSLPCEPSRTEPRRGGGDDGWRRGGGGGGGGARLACVRAARGGETYGTYASEC